MEIHIGLFQKKKMNLLEVHFWEELLEENLEEIQNIIDLLIGDILDPIMKHYLIE